MSWDIIQTSLVIIRPTLQAYVVLNTRAWGIAIYIYLWHRFDLKSYQFIFIVIASLTEWASFNCGVASLIFLPKPIHTICKIKVTLKPELFPQVAYLRL